MANSALFDMFRKTAVPASDTVPTSAPVQVSPQFVNWFRNYAQSYRGDPRQEISRLNLSAQQDSQVRAMVQRLIPLMGGR